MRFRPNKGSFMEAMRECVEIEGTMPALRAHIGDYDGLIEPDTIMVAPYSQFPDPRSGWGATYIVSATWRMGGVFPIGFTNAMPVSEADV